MGPALEASKADANTNLAYTLRAFPSPAISDVSLDSPDLVRSTYSPNPWTPRSACLDSSIMPSEPGAQQALTVLTPPLPIDQCHARLDLAQNMDLIVGGALAPVKDLPPSRPTAKSGRGLRLPSFEALGIAAPRPDRLAQENVDSAWADLARERVAVTITRPHSNPEPRGSPVRESELFDPAASNITSSSHTPHTSHVNNATLPEQPSASELTPPADVEQSRYDNMGANCLGMRRPQRQQAAGGTPSLHHSNNNDSDRGNEPPPDTYELNDYPPMTTEGTNCAHPPTGLWRGGIGLPHPYPAAPAPSPTPAASQRPLNHIMEAASWYEDATNGIVRDIDPTKAVTRVLSQALPYPAQPGNAFGHIIEAAQGAYPEMFLNVVHAISGRSKLEDLPKSPPTTPSANANDDYFAQKVFDSAVPVADYQMETSSLPRSPRPIVPPSSIDVAIVERYIPPATAREFERMFSTEGPSILIDRLTELTAKGGSLLFIYPTKTGAKTFNDFYLAPIVDPIFLSTAMTHRYPTDLGRPLTKKSVTDKLLEFHELQQKIFELVFRLGRSHPLAAHGSDAKYRVAYHSKKEVVLDRKTWVSDWWLKQEKPLITDTISKAAAHAQMKAEPALGRVHGATEVWQQLIKDIEHRQYESGTEPTRGVEVGVFVITRVA